MTQRSVRYPSQNARLIRLEEGPPMYRMLGYADKDNRCSDLRPYFGCPWGYAGPFSCLNTAPKHALPSGAGRFGLPVAPLPYTTYYWDESVYPSHHYVDRRPLNRLYHPPLPSRPEAMIFPERAVPGSGMNSKCVDSGSTFPCRM